MRSQASLYFFILCTLLSTVHSAHLNRGASYNNRVTDAATHGGPPVTKLTDDAHSSFSKELVAILNNILNRVKDIEAFLGISGSSGGHETPSPSPEQPTGGYNTPSYGVPTPSSPVAHAPYMPTIQPSFSNTWNPPTYPSVSQSSPCPIGSASLSHYPPVPTPQSSSWGYNPPITYSLHQPIPTPHRISHYHPGERPSHHQHGNHSHSQHGDHSHTGHGNHTHSGHGDHSHKPYPAKAYNQHGDHSPGHSYHITHSRSQHAAYTSTTTSTSTSTITVTLASGQTAPTSTPPTIVTRQPQSNNPSLYADSNSATPFNLESSSNVVVYYGQTPLTSSSSLLTLCQNPSVNVVNLGFVTKASGQNGYPEVDFGAACSGPTALQSSLAPGLQDCSQLGEQIKTCQSVYKKLVLVSVGGAIANVTFQDDAQATTFANQLWNLFGAGPGTANGQEKELRPFGDAVVDGFDIDNESQNPAHYTTFATALRQLYSAQGNTTPSNNADRKYYLSSTPQCPQSDNSIPKEVLLASDFVSVQFYNNPDCQVASNGFLDSVKTWSDTLAGGSGVNGKPPRLFVGVAAWSGVQSGYVDAATLKSEMGQVEQMKLTNLGGLMLWDGVMGLNNVDTSGSSFLTSAKETLFDTPIG